MDDTQGSPDLDPAVSPADPAAVAEPTADEVAAPGPLTLAPATKRRLQRRWHLFWREWGRPLLIIVLVMGSFRSAVADWNDVPTGSMKPTILEGDRIFINKVAYDLRIPFTMIRVAEWADPAWGDVVVVLSPEDGKRLVKRVVGLPGDTIEIRQGKLFVNGEMASYHDLDPQVIAWIDPETQPLMRFAEEIRAARAHPIMTHPYASSGNAGPLTVPPDHYFLMGDNRDNSRDSRWFGPVHRDAILGRATAVALSVDPEHYYRPRWKRFFSALP